MASLDECIVGRNGGNRFIILYERSSDLHLSVFLDRLADKVRDYNANKNNHPIRYEFGTAYAEADEVTSITRLIALSSMRLTDKLSNDSTENEAPAEETSEEELADIIAFADPDEEQLEPLPLAVPFTQEDIALIGMQKLQKLDTKRTRMQLFHRRTSM